MNNFDKIFFKKFIPEWQEMLHIVHSNPILIIKKIFVQIVLFVLIPIWFYYYSPVIQAKVPFNYLEIYLFLIYFKIIYSIFNWYNDVWIVTNSSVIAINWSFLKSNIETINFDSIEWLWVEEEWILDKILKKWTLIIHKAWEEEFILEEAINPYKAIDIIETASAWEEDEITSNITDERFNMILETLSEAIWDKVVDKKIPEEIPGFKDKEKIKQKIIKEAENSQWTIDLR